MEALLPALVIELILLLDEIDNFFFLYRGRCSLVL